MRVIKSSQRLIVRLVNLMCYVDQCAVDCDKVHIQKSKHAGCWTKGKYNLYTIYVLAIKCFLWSFLCFVVQESRV